MEDNLMPLYLPDNWDFTQRIPNYVIRFTEAVMMFPDKSNHGQYRSIDYAIMKMLADNDSDVFRLPNELLVQASRTMMEERPDLLSDKIENILEQATVVGQILYQAIHRHKRGININLKSIKDIWRTEYFNKTQKAGDNWERQIERLWSKFRGVSHLWAAHNYICVMQSDSYDPLSQENFYEFMVLSETIRKQGQRIIPKQSRAPLIHGTVHYFDKLPVNINVDFKSLIFSDLDLAKG